MSSQNALKSGLDADSQFVYGESREEFALLQQEYEDRFCPATPEERFFMDTLVRNEWLLRRLHRAEAHLWEHNMTHDAISAGTPLGAAFERVSPVFMRLQRRLTLCERSYKEALTELERLQARPDPPGTDGTVPRRAFCAAWTVPSVPEFTETPKLGSFLTAPALTGT